MAGSGGALEGLGAGGGAALAGARGDPQAAGEALAALLAGARAADVGEARREGAAVEAALLAALRQGVVGWGPRGLAAQCLAEVLLKDRNGGGGYSCSGQLHDVLGGKDARGLKAEARAGLLQCLGELARGMGSRAGSGLVDAVGTASKFSKAAEALVRREALAMLAAYVGPTGGDREAAKAQEEALRLCERSFKDKDERVRAAAIALVGAIGEAGAIGLWLQGSSGQGWEEARKLCVKALGDPAEAVAEAASLALAALAGAGQSPHAQAALVPKPGTKLLGRGSKVPPKVLKEAMANAPTRCLEESLLAAVMAGATREAVGIALAIGASWHCAPAQRAWMALSLSTKLPDPSDRRLQKAHSRDLAAGVSPGAAVAIAAAALLAVAAQASSGLSEQEQRGLMRRCALTLRGKAMDSLPDQEANLRDAEEESIRDDELDGAPFGLGSGRPAGSIFAKLPVAAHIVMVRAVQGLLERLGEAGSEFADIRWGLECALCSSSPLVRGEAMAAFAALARAAAPGEAVALLERLCTFLEALPGSPEGSVSARDVRGAAAGIAAVLCAVEDIELGLPSALWPRFTALADALCCALPSSRGVLIGGAARGSWGKEFGLDPKAWQAAGLHREAGWDLRAAFARHCESKELHYVARSEIQRWGEIHWENPACDKDGPSGQKRASPAEVSAVEAASIGWRVSAAGALAALAERIQQSRPTQRRKPRAGLFDGPVEWEAEANVVGTSLSVLLETLSDEPRSLDSRGRALWRMLELRALQAANTLPAEHLPAGARRALGRLGAQGIAGSAGPAPWMALCAELGPGDAALGPWPAPGTGLGADLRAMTSQTGFLAPPSKPWMSLSSADVAAFSVAAGRHEGINEKISNRALSGQEYWCPVTLGESLGEALSAARAQALAGALHRSTAASGPAVQKRRARLGSAAEHSAALFMAIEDAVAKGPGGEASGGMVAGSAGADLPPPNAKTVNRAGSAALLAALYAASEMKKEKKASRGNSSSVSPEMGKRLVSVGRGALRAAGSKGGGEASAWRRAGAELLARGLTFSEESVALKSAQDLGASVAELARSGAKPAAAAGTALALGAVHRALGGMLLAGEAKAAWSAASALASRVDTDGAWLWAAHGAGLVAQVHGPALGARPGSLAAALLASDSAMGAPGGGAAAAAARLANAAAEGLGPELALEPKLARALRACVAAPPASSPGMSLQIATWSRTAALCLGQGEGGSREGWGVLTGSPDSVARWLGEDAAESLAMGTEVRRVAAATLRHGTELAAAGDGGVALSVPMGAVVMALDSEPDPRARVQLTAALSALAAARASLGLDAVLPLRRLLLATALADLTNLKHELCGGVDTAADREDSGDDENEAGASESMKPVWAPRLRTRALAATLLARLPKLLAGPSTRKSASEWVGVGLRLVTNDAAAVRPAGAELLAWCAGALSGDTAVEFQAQFIAGTRALAAPRSSPPLRAAACRIAATLVAQTKIDAGEPAVVSRLASICGGVLLSNAASLPACAESHATSLYSAAASASARLANATTSRGDAIGEAAAKSLAPSGLALTALWAASVKEKFSDGRDLLADFDANESLLALTRYVAAPRLSAWAWPSSPDEERSGPDEKGTASLVVAAAAQMAAAAAGKARRGDDVCLAQVLAILTAAAGALSQADVDCGKALVAATAALVAARPGDSHATRAAAAVAAGTISTPISDAGAALATGIVCRGGEEAPIAVQACQDHAAAHPADAAALAFVCAQGLSKLDLGSGSGSLEKCGTLSEGVRQCLSKTPDPLTAAAVLAAELVKVVCCEEPSDHCPSFEICARIGIELQAFASECISSGRSASAIGDAALSSAVSNMRSALLGQDSGNSTKRVAIMAGFRSALSGAGTTEIVAPAEISRYILGVMGAEIVASAASGNEESSEWAPSGLSDEALKLLLSLARSLPAEEQTPVLMALVGCLVDCTSSGSDVAKRLLHAVISGAAQVDRGALKGALGNLNETQKTLLAQCMQARAGAGSAAQSPAQQAVRTSAPTGGLQPPSIGRRPAIALKRF